MSEQLPANISFLDKLRKRIITTSLNNNAIRTVWAKLNSDRLFEIALNNLGDNYNLLAKTLISLDKSSFSQYINQLMLQFYYEKDGAKKFKSVLQTVLGEAELKNRDDIALYLLDINSELLDYKDKISLKHEALESIQWYRKKTEEIIDIIDNHLFNFDKKVDAYYTILKNLDLDVRLKIMTKIVDKTLQASSFDLNKYKFKDILTLIPEENRKKFLEEYIDKNKKTRYYENSLIEALSTLPDKDRVELYPKLINYLDSSWLRFEKLNSNFINLFLTTKGLDEQKNIFEEIYSKLNIKELKYDHYLTFAKHIESSLLELNNREIFQNGLDKIFSLLPFEINNEVFKDFFKLFNENTEFDNLLYYFKNNNILNFDTICRLYLSSPDISSKFTNYLSKVEEEIDYKKIAEFENKNSRNYTLTDAFKIFNQYFAQKDSWEEKTTLVNMLNENRVQHALIHLFDCLSEDDKITNISKFTEYDPIIFNTISDKMKKNAPETLAKCLNYIFIQNINENNLNTAKSFIYSLKLDEIEKNIKDTNIDSKKFSEGRNKYAYMIKQQLDSNQDDNNNQLITFFDFLNLLSPDERASYIINLFNNDNSSRDYSYCLRYCESYYGNIQKIFEKYDLKFMSDEKFEQVLKDGKDNSYIKYFYGMQLARTGRLSEAIKYVIDSGIENAYSELYNKLTDEEKLNVFCDFSKSTKITSKIFDMSNENLKKQILNKYLFSENIDVETGVNLLKALNFSDLIANTDKNQTISRNNIKLLISNNNEIFTKALFFDPSVDKNKIQELTENRQLTFNTNTIDINSVLIKLYSDTNITLDEFNGKLDDIYRIFTYNNIPEFLKTFRIFQVGKYYNVTNYNLVSIKDKKPEERDELFLGDLFRISLDSNEKSLRTFAQVLKEGKRLTTILQRNPEEMINKLSEVELASLYQYRDTLFDLHNFTKEIKANNRPRLKASDNIIEDLKTLSNTYAENQENRRNIVFNPHKILDELMGENVSAQIRPNAILNYMDKIQTEADKRHSRYSKMMKNNELHLETGDFIKGIRYFDSYIKSMLTEGVKCGEFNKEYSHTDGTKLDADFGYITDHIENKEKMTDGQIISKTISYGYGNTFIVMKNYKERLNAKEGTAFDNGTINTKPDYYGDESSSKASYYVRTGIGSNDIDYIVSGEWKPRYGYEMAMAGKFIPVKDLDDNVLFSEEDYLKIREQMRGLSYYNADPFIIDKKVTNMETLYDLYRLISINSEEETEKEIQSVKDMINGKEDTVTNKKMHGTLDLIYSYFNELGISVTNNIGLNLSSNSVECIDTGSTGRGTNTPGNGDFDLMLRHNTSSEILEGLKNYIKSRTTSSFLSLNDGFRAKDVMLDNGELVDIDVTFAKKNLTLDYTSDLCIKDRLNSIEEQNPEKLRYIKANIIMAKKILKASGIYKKLGSNGATEYGGFGGIGVENWVLQNGGSFIEAISTYLEAANEASSYSDFIDKYPIFDFGNNQREGYNMHDRFSSFLKTENSIGYKKVKEILKQYLDFIKDKATPLQESFSVEGFKECVSNTNEMKDPSNFVQTILMIAKLKTINKNKIGENKGGRND